MGERLKLGQGAWAYLYTKDRETYTDREKVVGRTKAMTRAPGPPPSSNEQEQGPLLAREGRPGFATRCVIHWNCQTGI